MGLTDACVCEFGMSNSMLPVSCFRLFLVIIFHCLRLLLAAGRSKEGGKTKNFASKFSDRNEMLERIAEGGRGRGATDWGMCQHLFLLSDLGKTFQPSPLFPPGHCCQPTFRLAFVPGIMVRQHARHGNRELAEARRRLRCYLKYRKCFTKLSEHSYNAADWADLAEWLPHNRRQVEFIFLTNNMNFKEPVSHFSTVHAPPLAACRLPLAA